jgi:hypothetical protein
MNEHFVEPTPVRLILRLVAEVPFAKDTGRVAGALQHLRNRSGIGRQSFPFEDRVRDSIPELMPSRHQRGPRRCAGWTHLEISEAHALAVERIEMRRLENGIPMASEVAVSLVIGEDENDIRASRGLAGDGGGQSEAAKQRSQPGRTPWDHRRDVLRNSERKQSRRRNGPGGSITITAQEALPADAP